MIRFQGGGGGAVAATAGGGGGQAAAAEKEEEKKEEEPAEESEDEVRFGFHSGFLCFKRTWDSLYLIEELLCKACAYEPPYPLTLFIMHPIFEEIRKQLTAVHEGRETTTLDVWVPEQWWEAFVYVVCSFHYKNFQIRFLHSFTMDRSMHCNLTLMTCSFSFFV